MSGLNIGCAGFPVDPAEYATQLDFVEIQETFHESRPIGEIRRDLDRVAGEVSIGLVASKVITHPRRDPVYKVPGPDVPDHAAVGHFTRSRWTDEAWERTDALLREIRARVVVLRTPKSFRKTQANALALENFVAHAERPGLEIVWDHGGVWPEADAKALAERLGLIISRGLTVKEIPDGDLYVRYDGGASGRSSLSETALGKATDLLRGRNGFAVFGNASGWEDARRLAKAL